MKKKAKDRAINVALNTLIIIMCGVMLGMFVHLIRLGYELMGTLPQL